VLSEYKNVRKNGKKKPQSTRTPIGVTIEVSITSLNSHFTEIYSGTECGDPLA